MPSKTKKKHVLHASVRALKKDRHIGPLMKKHGLPDYEPTKNPFQSLARAIVHQQLSGKAAETIFKRFVALYPKGTFPKPEAVLKTSFTKLRSVGLSGQKASYLLDLAKKFADGTINPKKFARMTDEEIIAHLVQVKGIGEWSAQMFLMFGLNRPNVLPTKDLGIQKGMQKLFKTNGLPKPDTMKRLAKRWDGHHTLASWYLWRVVDTKGED